MSYKSRGPGPPGFWYICNFFVIFFVSLQRIIHAEKHNNFYVRSLCKSHFMQGIYRQTDGGLLISENDKNSDCIMTFQTHTVLQRFMVKFTRLRLDCNDFLYVYDGGNAVGNVKAKLSCRNTTEGFGIMFTGTNFLTLKYVTDAWGTEENGFEMLMTAFKDQTIQTCYDFQCSFKNLCISKDLICDGIDHCMDGSDEAAPKPCKYSRNALVFSGISTHLLIPLTFIMALLVIMSIIVVIVYIRTSGSRSISSSTHSMTNLPLENMRGANGASIGLVDGTTIISNNNKCVQKSIPGNWHRPAGLKLGYSEVRVRLYYQAK